MTQADVDGLGEGTIDLQIQIWDDDPMSDDFVQENMDQLGGPFNLGPNSFEAEVLVTYSKVAASDPGQMVAELFAR